MYLYLRHLHAQRRLEGAWSRLATPTITMQPQPWVRVRFLVEGRAASGMAREPGVSYLVSTPSATVLFDLGYNREDEDPTPLARNVVEMGLENHGVDAVFISHNHFDHVGGMRAQRTRRPDLDRLPPCWRTGAPVYAPCELTHASRRIEVVTGAMEILPGMASTGPMPAHLYFLGSLVEQSLLVDVENHGLVLVSGCGHPGIVPMVRHAARVTGRQVRTVVGGLHLVASGGMPVPRYLGGSGPPWRAPTTATVRTMMEALRSMGVTRLLPSPHDSCPAALGVMQEVFGDGLDDVVAGGEWCSDPAGPVARPALHQVQGAQVVGM
jgi:7,8-dihydropterin-6-yl-methyl-4-(beta-D-ribofuranosyl)aminobenzene 5'-phosphate synthase